MLDVLGVLDAAVFYFVVDAGGVRPSDVVFLTRRAELQGEHGRRLESVE